MVVTRFVDDRFRDFGRVHQVVVWLGYHERGVGTVDRGVDKPGFAVGRQPLQLVEHLAHHERRFRLVCSERGRRPTGSPSVGDGHVGAGSQEPPAVRDVMAPILQPPVPSLPVLGEFQGYAEPG